MTEIERKPNSIQIIQNKFINPEQEETVNELEKSIHIGWQNTWHQENHRTWIDNKDDPQFLAKKVPYGKNQVKNSLKRKRNELTIEQRSNSLIRQMDAAYYFNVLFEKPDFKKLLSEFSEINTLLAVNPLMGSIESNDKKTLFFPYISHDTDPKSLPWFNKFLEKFDGFLRNLKIDPYDLIKPSQFLIKKTGDKYNIYIIDLEFVLTPKTT